MKIRFKTETVKSWAILLLMLISVSVANAQDKVSGVVKDDTGETMPGVSVTVKGSKSVGAVTDIDGNFTISVSRGAVLTFSFLGYNPQEVKATPGKQMIITMQEDNKTLNEVVVVGYQPVRQRDLTGAVSKADVKGLTSTPVSSFDQTLGGRLAGVNVSSNEGMPGGKMNMVIRGNNSLTQENSPLYVVDGFPVEDASVASSINPLDIQSVNVLKDASATAIYGARGANGVVIITTKSGQEGKIREWLVKEHWISAVIGLPDKLFLNTAIPVFLLILEKNSPDLLFIDASRQFEKKSAQNDMSQEQMRDVTDAFFARKDVEKYAYVASYQEIKYNDYNLNIPRYVDTFEPEPLPDMEALLKELQKIENEERKTRKELYKMLEELVGSKEDMNVMKEHRKLLKPQNTRNTFRQMTLEDYQNAM